MVLKNYFTVDPINSASESVIASAFFCSAGVRICEFGDYEYVIECTDQALYRVSDFDGSGCAATCVGSNYYNDPVELLC